ncbi:hypothetical protein [Pantoea sp. PNA 03-3]|uniref:hypothetical protein n=1 Tax=Pantoea sp. PNA 03-3 TaxID=2135460 RepID=UPI0013049A5F|nr:hypothetical protein [Pantoea sp. PNA 03-3]
MYIVDASGLRALSVKAAVNTPSTSSLLDKNLHDAVAVSHSAAFVVVKGDTTFANLFSGNAVLLCPFAEFLIAAFAIDKVDINGAFIDENGG